MSVLLPATRSCVNLTRSFVRGISWKRRARCLVTVGDTVRRGDEQETAGEHKRTAGRSTLIDDDRRLTSPRPKRPFPPVLVPFVSHSPWTSSTPLGGGNYFNNLLPPPPPPPLRKNARDVRGLSVAIAYDQCRAIANFSRINVPRKDRCIM